MRIASICILYTQDGDLARRVKAFLRTMALVRHVTDPNRMEAALQQNSEFAGGDFNGSAS